MMSLEQKIENFISSIDENTKILKEAQVDKQVKIFHSKWRDKILSDFSNVAQIVNRAKYNRIQLKSMTIDDFIKELGRKYGLKFSDIIESSFKQNEILDANGTSGKYPLYHFITKDKEDLYLTLVADRNVDANNKTLESDAAFMEEVICVAWNHYICKMSLGEAIKVAKVKRKEEDYEPYMNNMESFCHTLEKVSKSRAPLIHSGLSTSKSHLSSFWLQNGGSAGTPKTDLYFEDKKFRISLKKAGGSQLMSAAQGETIATLNAAFEYTKESNDPEFKKLITTITEHFKKYEDVSITDVKKKFKAGEEELTDKEQDIIETDRMHKEILSIAKDFFSNNTEFSKYFIYEAMSGNKKFKTEECIADCILVWKQDSVQSFKVINDAYCRSLAPQVKLDVAFKSMNRKSTSSFRVILKEEFERHYNRLALLTEDVLEEGIIDWVKNTFKKIFKFLQEAVKKGFRYLMEFLDMDIENIKFSNIIIF